MSTIHSKRTASVDEIAHSGYGLDVKGRSVERPCRGVDAPKQGRFRFGTTPIRGRVRPVMQELSPSIGGNLRQFLHHFKACHKEYDNGPPPTKPRTMPGLGDRR